MRGIPTGIAGLPEHRAAVLTLQSAGRHTPVMVASLTSRSPSYPARTGCKSSRVRARGPREVAREAASLAGEGERAASRVDMLMGSAWLDGQHDSFAGVLRRR